VARPYRAPYGVGGGPFAFDSRIRLADGNELSAGIVRACTPMDAARHIERANADFIRWQLVGLVSDAIDRHLPEPARIAHQAEIESMRDYLRRLATTVQGEQA
jgi:hypothetical protein